MWHCNDLGSSRIPFDAKTSLHTAQGSLTANAYTNQIVDPYVLLFYANQGITFQQDGAHLHTVRATLCLGLRKAPISM